MLRWLAFEAEDGGADVADDAIELVDGGLYAEGELRILGAGGRALQGDAGSEDPLDDEIVQVKGNAFPICQHRQLPMVVLMVGSDRLDPGQLPLGRGPFPAAPVGGPGSSMPSVERGRAGGASGSCPATGVGGLSILGLMTGRAPLAPPALHVGLRAVFAFPLRVGAVRLGALDVYTDRRGPLSGDQHAGASVMADVVASWVLDTQAGAPLGSVAAALDAEADFHLVVHNAAGMVSVQLGVSVTEAILRLRGYAFSHGQPLTSRPRTSSRGGSASNDRPRSHCHPE